MPNTRSRGSFETALATWHIASRGFETTTTIALGERLTASFVTAPTMASFVVTRSSRLMPGARGFPAVTTMTSEPAVSSYPFVPVMFGSYESTAAAWFMSSALPCGKFGMMSTSTTSA